MPGSSAQILLILREVAPKNQGCAENLFRMLQGDLHGFKEFMQRSDEVSDTLKDPVVEKELKRLMALDDLSFLLVLSLRARILEGNNKLEMSDAAIEKYDEVFARIGKDVNLAAPAFTLLNMFINIFEEDLLEKTHKNITKKDILLGKCKVYLSLIGQPEKEQLQVLCELLQSKAPFLIELAITKDKSLHSRVWELFEDYHYSIPGSYKRGLEAIERIVGRPEVLGREIKAVANQSVEADTNEKRCTIS